ncbi:MAG: hypothetical protein Q7T16_00295 [Candidatus Burarchaeum sp.]|nr:hypothetical protein [Candidatus Burarchaeum sp.]MDO8339078.1 hypothetical protein [Candidatus Burarchaeum sp.]
MRVLPSGHAFINCHRRVPYFVGFKETNGRMPSTRDLYDIEVLNDRLFDNLCYADKLSLKNDEMPDSAKGLYFKGTRGDDLHAWGRMWIATPEKGQRFHERQDITDAKTGNVLLSSELKNALGGDPFKPGVSLHIDPADFEDINGRRLITSDPGSFNSNRGVLVIPKSITVVEKNLQKHGQGKVDGSGLVVKYTLRERMRVDANGDCINNINMNGKYERNFCYFNSDAESLNPLIRRHSLKSSYDGFIHTDLFSSPPSESHWLFELVTQLTLEQLKNLADAAKIAMKNLASGVREKIPFEVASLIAAIERQDLSVDK